MSGFAYCDEMEIRHLRYFVAVAEERNFSRAAERLHMAQPPLSAQIRQLEDEIGVRLLARTTRSVELTPAGGVFLEQARLLLERAETAAEHARRAARGEMGRLRLGFTGSATYELLPALTRAFRERHPDVVLELTGEMLTPAQVEGLLAGRLDVGFLRPPVHAAGLEVHVVRREPLIAVLPAQHRLAEHRRVRLAELAGEPFVTYPSQWRSVVYDAVVEACRASGFAPSVKLEVRETATLVSFVAAGLGVALVPASVRHLEVTGAVTRPLRGTTTMVELAVAWRAGDTSAVLARFLAVARAFLGGPWAPAAAVGGPDRQEMPALTAGDIQTSFI